MSDIDDIDLFAGPHRPSHIYVHVPFCRSKCSYCDFASVAGADPDLVATVFGGLRSEVRRWGEWALPGVVETVYVGGGTPTYVAEHTVRLVCSLAEYLPLREHAEITVEANPESLTREVAGALAQAGATRVSVGVQSFDDGVLRMLGRPHTADEAAEACRFVLRAGLDLSLDLMCGVPGQTMASWQESLDRALRCEARHMSVYPLAVAQGTPLAVAVDTGLVSEPDSDLAADMMLLAEEVLRRGGLERYEVSNYAVPGAESRHNTAYWTGDEYVGIGPSAHGMLGVETARALGMIEGDCTEVGRVRYAEPAGIDQWLTSPEAREVELLTPEEACREDLMLGMRLTRGVEAAAVRAARLEPVFARLAENGLVELDSATAHWRTTTRGWLLGNEVFLRVWAGE